MTEKYSLIDFSICDENSIGQHITISNVVNHTDFTKTHYPKRLNQFKSNPLKCGEIVFLGDSLTEEHTWDRAISHELPIRNRGVRGDTSDGLLLRMGELLAAKPKVIFLMIGTNDLWTSNTSQATFNNILRISELIRTYSSSSILVLQTVLPIRSEPLLINKIQNINHLIRNMSTENKLVILDTYKLMSDAEGKLNKSLTYDGVHLNSRGYRVWSDEVNTILQSIEDLNSQ